MKDLHDVLVIGLGVMGAAALWRASQKSACVLGIEAAGPTHNYGSSHGASRIFRRAYWEGEKYLPALIHADLLWNELEQSIGRQILFRTGGIFIGPRSSSVVAGSIKAAIQGNIDHKILSSSNIRTYLPAIHLQDGVHALYEPGAYVISAYDSRLGMLNEAVQCGASIQFGDSVINLENHKLGIQATTKCGFIHYAKSAIITTGPWIAEKFMPELKQYIQPRQVPIYWFNQKIKSEEYFSKKNFPVFLYERDDGGILYGVPSIGSTEPGVKIGFHNRQQDVVSPDWKNFSIQQKYITEISETVKSLFPQLDHSPIKAKSCFYTMSLDESFLIGQSKILKAAYFASACSGHGYKFAPAIGDALADMAVSQKPSFSLSAFSVDRFIKT
ncbi:N-methyl-L-tryptophan oxidase [Pseudomonas sp. 18175]|uniref:N-methyl-L-tryptophan oxidase n=1 Tax=Pseudomonas sp. 18175 TaxID=3390056 RepID=UPI003D22F6CD